MTDEIQKPKTSEEQTVSEAQNPVMRPQSPDAQRKSIEDQGKQALEIAQMSLKEIKQKEKQEIRDMFLSEPEIGKGKGEYLVDFKGNQKAEKTIGLHDLFGADTPLVIVRDKNENPIYAERGKDGFYYETGTNKKVTIFTEYGITVPTSPEELAELRKQAEPDRVANIKEAKRKEAIAKRRTEKTEDAPVVAKEKDTDPKQKLLAYLTDMPDYVWTEAQKTTVSKALLSFKSDLNVSKNGDADLVDNVFRYFIKNPNLSERQLVTMATYASMPDSTKEQLVSALQEKKFELTVKNPKTIDMLGRILEEFVKSPNSMAKEEWSRLISKVQTKNSGSKEA
jgi:hypothetical protein